MYSGATGNGGAKGHDKTGTVPKTRSSKSSCLMHPQEQLDLTNNLSLLSWQSAQLARSSPRSDSKSSNANVVNFNNSTRALPHRGTFKRAASHTRSANVIPPQQRQVIEKLCQKTSFSDIDEVNSDPGREVNTWNDRLHSRQSLRQSSSYSNFCRPAQADIMSSTVTQKDNTQKRNMRLLPDPARVYSRLTEIRRYIEQISTVMESLQNSRDQEIIAQYNEMAKMRLDLMDSERKLGAMLDSLQRGSSSAEIPQTVNERSAGRSSSSNPTSSPVQQEDSSVIGACSLQANQLSTATLKEKLDESQKKMRALEAQQQRLLSLQRQAEMLSREVRSAQHPVGNEPSTNLESGLECVQKRLQALQLLAKQNMNIGFDSEEEVPCPEHEIQNKLTDLQQKKHQMDVLMNQLAMLQQSQTNTNEKDDGRAFHQTLANAEEALAAINSNLKEADVQQMQDRLSHLQQNCERLISGNSLYTVNPGECISIQSANSTAGHPEAVEEEIDDCDNDPHYLALGSLPNKPDNISLSSEHDALLQERMVHDAVIAEKTKQLQQTKLKLMQLKELVSLMENSHGQGDIYHNLPPQYLQLLSELEEEDNVTKSNTKGNSSPNMQVPLESKAKFSNDAASANDDMSYKMSELSREAHLLKQQLQLLADEGQRIVSKRHQLHDMRAENRRPSDPKRNFQHVEKENEASLVAKLCSDYQALEDMVQKGHTEIPEHRHELDTAGNDSQMLAETTTNATWGGSTQENFDEFGEQYIHFKEHSVGGYSSDDEDQEEIPKRVALNCESHPSTNVAQNVPLKHSCLTSTNTPKPHERSVSPHFWENSEQVLPRRQGIDDEMPSSWKPYQIPSAATVSSTSQLQSQLQQQLDMVSNMCRTLLSESQMSPRNSFSTPTMSPLVPPPAPTLNSLPSVSHMDSYAAQLQQRQQLLMLNQCIQLLWLQQQELHSLHQSVKKLQETQPILHTSRESLQSGSANVHNENPPINRQHSNTSANHTSRNSAEPISSPLAQQSNITDLNFSSMDSRTYSSGTNHANMHRVLEELPTTLNNQVPPGSRANNYWDNFRSYSRQNLLSSKTNDNMSQGSTTVATSATYEPAPDLHPGMVPKPKASPNLRTNNYSQADCTPRSPGAAKPDCLPFVSNIERKQRTNRDQQYQVASSQQSPIQTDALLPIVAGAPGSSNSNSSTVTNVPLNHSKGMQKCTSSSAKPRGAEGPVTHTSPFDDLRDNIYAEVAALISQNENEPQYLIHLFQQLQHLNSNPMRSRALHSLRQLAAGDTLLRGGAGAIPKYRQPEQGRTSIVSQVESVLEREMAKFEGKRVQDINEDLMKTVSEILLRDPVTHGQESVADSQVVRTPEQKENAEIPMEMTGSPAVSSPEQKCTKNITNNKEDTVVSSSGNLPEHAEALSNPLVTSSSGPQHEFVLYDMSETELERNGDLAEADQSCSHLSIEELSVDEDVSAGFHATVDADSIDQPESIAVANSTAAASESNGWHSIEVPIENNTWHNLDDSVEMGLDEVPTKLPSPYVVETPDSTELIDSTGDSCVPKNHSPRNDS